MGELQGKHTHAAGEGHGRVIPGWIFFFLNVVKELEMEMEMEIFS